MRGEKDLLDNFVNFFVMEYFFDCYNVKCFVKFSFKDLSKRFKVYQFNRFSIKKLGYMIVIEGKKVFIFLQVFRIVVYMLLFLEFWLEIMVFFGFKRINYFIRIFDFLIRFEVVFFVCKM